MEGSNDGEEFATLLDVELEQPCAPGAPISRAFENENAYKFYRLFVEEVPGRGTKKYLVLENLSFYGGWL